MKQNLLYDFSVDRENRTIVVKREYDAALPIVWNAYTRSEILDQWWAPKPWKSRTKTLDFKEGGRWLYAMVGPQGEEHWAIADYTSIEPQKSFSVKDAFSDAEGNINKDMPQAQWDVGFTNQGDTTLVTFVITYSDVAQLEATLQMGFEEGLSFAMEGLDELLPSLKK